MRNQLIAILRHGTDLPDGERPLADGEADFLATTMAPQVRHALHGDPEEIHSSPLLRARQTATAIAGTNPVEHATLAKYPKYDDAVMAYAKAHRIDSTEAFFRVMGLAAGLKLAYDTGGYNLMAFIEHLGNHPAERILVVTHGGSMEAFAERLMVDFSQVPTFKKGEGFVVRWDGLEREFVSFLRR